MRKIILIGYIILLAGCSIAEKERPRESVSSKIDQFETTYNRNNTMEVKLIFLTKLLREYAKIDNIEKQLQTHLTLATIYHKADEDAAAQIHLQEALNLDQILQDKQFEYELALAQGVISHDNKALEKAHSLADNDLEKAIVYAHMNNGQAALKHIEKNQLDIHNAQDFAFVYYVYAKSENDIRYAQKALELYKQTEQSAGIAKSLLLLAKLYKGKDEQAYKAYLYRASIVSNVLEETKIQTKVKKEIEALWQE